MPVRLRARRGVSALVVVLLGVALTTTLTSPASASVAPVITSPEDGAVLCSPTAGVVVAGTASPNADMRVFVNAELAYSGFSADGAGAWQITMSHVGDITLTATQNDGSGFGPASTPVTVHVDQRPTFYVEDAVTYPGRVISPANGDGELDAIDLSVYVSPTVGQLVYSVVDAGDVTVRQYPPVPASPDGWQTLTWDGKNDLGEFVADGKYRARAVWSDEGSSCVLTRNVAVGVDNAAPMFTAFNKAYPVFYPMRNDDLIAYRNSISFSVKDLDTTTYATLRIFQGASTTPIKKRGPSYGYPDSSLRLYWTGDVGGEVAPEGTYEADVVLLDEYGNRTITPRVSFGLSYDHLVARHRFVSVSGEQFSKKDQDNSCGLKIRPGASKYAHGAVLDYCGKRDADVSLVAYVVRAPKAAYLHTLNAAVYGRSPSGNNVALIAWNWDRPKRSVTRLAGPREGLHAAGSAYSVEHFVDDDGWALVWAGFAGQGRYDYDIRDIGFKFTYGVLVS